MNEKKSEPELFHAFFREEAADMFVTHSVNKQAPPKDEARSAVPVMPVASEAGEKERKTYWRALRQFLRTAKGGGIFDGKNHPMAFPAALAPYRGQAILEGDYPCWIGDDLVSVRRLLSSAIGQFAPEDQEARILKDNLPRLEQLVRERFQKGKYAIPAPKVWEESLQALRKKLNIPGQEGETFHADLQNLQKYLPQTGTVIAFSAHTPVLQLSALIHNHFESRRREVEEAVLPLLGRLRTLLEVERQKSPEARSTEHLKGSMDFAGAFLNFEEMSQMLPQAGSVDMPRERLLRLEKAGDILKKRESLLFSSDALFVLEKGFDASLSFDWEKYLPQSKVQLTAKGESAKTALELFDKIAARAAEFFAALRTVRLEVENQYDPELHDDFFAHFNFLQFSEEELASCPPVFLFSDSDALLEKEWTSFSKILASKRPVKTIAFRMPGRTIPEGIAFRQEPGALAIAHRDAFVFQSAGVNPAALFQGLKEGLNCSFPALFHLLSPEPGNALLAAGAVEGREFPGFVYDCRKGPKWGSRFDIQDNPEPASDWSLLGFAFQGEGGTAEKKETTFTFADYASMDPAYSRYFNLVPPEFWTDDLVPVSEYLGLKDRDRYTRAPFIWMVNGKNELVRAAVAWPLVQICQERLDFWHFLQENAGVHSYHVEQATDLLRRDMEASGESALAGLRAEHERELEQVRESAGREAMERLASMLLDLDTTAMPAEPRKTSSPAPEPPKADPAPAPQEQAPPKKEEPEEVIPAGEAWIESALCTSCNECTNINKQVFKYNGSKQAYVADPKAGTFAQIVKAAESCPVGIIHPGAPQNPDEKGLEGLIKRAAPFN